MSILLITDSSYMDGALVEIASRNRHWTRVVEVPVREWATPSTAAHLGLVGTKDLRLHPLVASLDCAAFHDLNTVCAETENALPDPPDRLTIWSLAAGVAPSDPRPIYATTPDERDWAFHWLVDRFGFTLANVVGVAPVSADPQRSLPSASCRQIFAAIEDWGGKPLFLDRSTSLEGYGHANGLTFAQTAAIVEQLDAVVAVDSGLLHVAGTLGTPLLGLFGSIPARKRMAYYAGRALQSNLPCSPCWYRRYCEASPDPNDLYACMRFDANKVVEYLDEMLNGGNQTVRDAV